METERICQSCHKPLRPDLPLGLCPECLIKAGFNTGTEPGTKNTGFIPPPVEQIANLFPQLEIIGLIGKGGMGAVYKARQPALDRFVALKILPPKVVGGPGFADRFNREARALARLTHPNIVAVHDFGQSGGLHYLVMEFVDGPNLREVERAGPLAPEQALAIVPQICEALQFAHGEGVVHRDIKPENILLDKKGRVKIADFGIAKILGVPAGKVSLTGARDVIGTPHYMAPEQVEHPATVDHRADIYSLGVVFYEMLTGELPLGKFQAPSQKVQVDVRLDEVVLRALEKELERRYQQASDVKTEVETIAGTSAPDLRKATASKTVGTPLFPVSFGLTFTSRLALNVARLGWALGCLGALGFLGFIPGLLWLRGLFGFAGFFGLIGLAVAMEGAHRIKHPVAGFLGKPRMALLMFATGIAATFVAVTLLLSIFAARRSNSARNEAKAAAEREASWITNAPSASAQTWSPALAPGEKTDLQQIFQEARDLMNQGRYEEALQRRIWYHNHSKFDPAQAGVRNSFALSDWIELGRRYPKARQALIEIRNADARQFSEGRGYFALFMEVSSINESLGEEDATLPLFNIIGAKDKKLAQQCYFVVEPQLVQRGDYALCLSYIGDPQARFETIRQSWERTKAMENRLPKMADATFVAQTRQLIEILVGAGRKPDAEQIRDQALAILDDPRLKSAVSDAEERIQKRAP